MTLNERLLSIPPDKFNYLLKYCQRSNKILGMECKELIFLPYWTVKAEIPNMVNEANLSELIETVLKNNGKKVRAKRLNKLPLKEAIPFLCWIRDSVKRIYDIEREHLTSQPDADLHNAGIETLNELGEINIIDTLAQGDVLKWEEVKRLPYETVFDKLRKNKLEIDIQKRLAKIMKSKKN